MKDKIISGLIGAILWWAIVFGYTSIFAKETNTMIAPASFSGTTRNFDTQNMTDEQLATMAERAGITTEEIKAKLDAGESLRDIVPRPERGDFWGNQNNTQTWTQK